MDFVPEGRRDEKVPCRHIPLNEIAESLDTLYNTASMEEVKNVLREWLKTEIARLERSEDAPERGAA